MKTKHYIAFLFLVFGILQAYCQNSTFKIATFNIQNFGQKKLAKPDVLDTLVAIVQHFDIVAVQEISDASNKTADAFLKEINKGGAKYAMSLSERSGKQPDDASSVEQYVFYYNTATVKLLDAALYNDVEHDYFQREPYIGQFVRKSDGLSFVLCTVHTRPEQAVAEIGNLVYVAKWIPSRFKNAERQVFCGDFNASCSYANPAELEALAIHKTPYVWIVPEDTKTNLSKKTCAYDRFVITDNLKSVQKDWGVYRYFKTKAVSDHWPVFVEWK